MILLSAHKDVVKYPFNLSFKDGKYYGLLDNFCGQLICNSLLLSEPSIRHLERVNKIGFFFGEHEEWSLDIDFPKLKKEDIVIVVDVAINESYNKIDFSLENISGFSKDKIKGIKEHLEWENFKLHCKEWDGTPDDEDEVWEWKKRGQKVIAFIIPIKPPNKNEGWHVEHCTVSIDRLVLVQHGLKRLINYLL